MLIKDFLPNNALREFIRCYRIVHFEFDELADSPFKAYPPKPEECLLFYLRDREEVELLGAEKLDYQFQVALFGQQTSLIKRYAGKNFFNFQIVFQSTALFRLTGIPSYELTNRCIDAKTIFSNNICFVLEELQHAMSYGEMLGIADKFVAMLIKNTKKEAHQLDVVSNLMLQSNNNISVDYLAKETNLCIKQFKRKFNERAGINPKMYARIIRLTKAFNTKNANPDWDWLRVAIECNYYDYQHLVKDFHNFTGLSPNALFQYELNAPESRLGLTNELYQSRFTATF
ncbi:AraC family transcriptional regulator [Chitinophaga silvatica]|uniref:AraC family transcriptional regulator n=1 Tax=Chitinophaga silvatica TaxID=2282649 RepID=A0A3E1YH48_9BACT|nr:helix-turn-helix domain-containing protein [Chitinophaga silvatica]RFS26721.1 AraC family transcriptional regulator [Chitinophaga silvatica]